jgi:8-oxo-dGTP pyrophosphatase MutT (NUDIX family)
MRAGAFIVDKGKILLIHRFFQGREYYVIPGGGVEEGETIEYAISIAKSGRKDMVLICDSHSGGHSSNREPVATAISASAARLGWPHGPELRSTKETNFNGYDIWKQGQTRLVWSV